MRMKMRMRKEGRDVDEGWRAVSGRVESGS